MGFMVSALLLVPLTVLLYVRINTERELSGREIGKEGAKWSSEELRRLGDRAPDFTYTL